MTNDPENEAPAPAELADPAPEADAPVATIVDTSEAVSAAESAPVEPQPPAPAVAGEPPAEGDAKPSNKRWYVVKVQSGREETVREAIERKVKIEGLEQYFGQVVVPFERETVIIQSGKRKGQRMVKKKKKFPGYIMAEVEYNDKILYLFRETSGVGDFVGATLTKPPLPMSDFEVQRMLSDQEDVPAGTKEKSRRKVAMAPVKINFNVGDKVRVRDGLFAGQEGEIREIREPKDETENHVIRVTLIVFGRPTTVELQHYQIEAI